MLPTYAEGTVLSLDPAVATLTVLPLSAPFCLMRRKDDGIEEANEKSPFAKTELKPMLPERLIDSIFPDVERDAL